MEQGEVVPTVIWRLSTILFHKLGKGLQPVAEEEVDKTVPISILTYHKLPLDLVQEKTLGHNSKICLVGRTRMECLLDHGRPHRDKRIHAGKKRILNADLVADTKNSVSIVMSETRMIESDEIIGHDEMSMMTGGITEVDLHEMSRLQESMEGKVMECSILEVVDEVDLGLQVKARDHAEAVLSEDVFIDDDVLLERFEILGCSCKRVLA